MKPLAGQFGRFLTVGVGNTAISWIAYLVLVRLGTPPPGAAGAAFAAGAANGYAWNSRWTFGRKVGVDTLRRYLAVQAGGVAGSAAIVAALAGALGQLPAYAVATVVVTFATFAANRSWAFRRSGSI
ncbi:MAG: GtrA family protein [Gaiellales bacterium]